MRALRTPAPARSSGRACSRSASCCSRSPAAARSGRSPHRPPKEDPDMWFRRVPALLLLVLLACVSVTIAQSRQPEVPYVPTDDKIGAQMLSVANVAKNDVLYDLGSGDGRIVITAAKKFGTRGVGVDIDPVRVKEA